MTEYTQSEICDLTGWSRSTFFRIRDDADRGFPDPINPGERPLKWRAREVDGWLDENDVKDDISPRDRMLMELFSDEYANAFETAAENTREEMRFNANDERAELEKDALDDAFDAEKDEWIREAVCEIEAEADEGDDNDDEEYPQRIETRARELFDADLASDPARYALIVSEAGGDDHDAALERQVRRAAHAEAIKEVRKIAAKSGRRASASVETS